MATQLQDRDTPCLAVAPSNPRPTVLVFGSGVGGLSVYDGTRRLLPDLHYIYALDNVASPYGEKSEEFIVERAIGIVITVQQHYPLSPAVIACNTVSTVSLLALCEKFAFPIMDVIPAVKPAARLTANGVVGLLATRATVKRPYTHELTTQFANEYQIAMLGFTKPVEFVEAKLHGETVSPEELRRTLCPWLRASEPPDIVVLGCTHFPLLWEEFLRVLPKGMRLADSGAATARHMAWLLEHEVPDAKSTNENVAFRMAMATKAEQLLSVLQRYSLKILEKPPV